MGKSLLSLPTGAWAFCLQCCLLLLLLPKFPELANNGPQLFKAHAVAFLGTRAAFPPGPELGFWLSLQTTLRFADYAPSEGSASFCSGFVPSLFSS